MPRKAPQPIPTGLLSCYATIKGPRTWRSIKLAIDTGATYTMVPPDLLADVGYDPATTTRRLELSTASGLVIVPLLRIQAMTCLGQTVRRLEVVAHHLPPESPVEGLLGLNLLVHVASFQTFRRALRPFCV